ncbi:LLM class flavin-dependent oxidoreductase [Agreia sp. VKM Ac-1783]|uniref:LLM class flavin-dependent oxidoreductase n=1 Tax=Agreia sp. VKM Ac-1783 TaxID=1938889 RepID=UPI000A2AC9D8|nr:LLM class flavin-dependent oxidoreductase [Agreia sp. VKM Ac-1783]SMQ59167.1 Flavin-dependent oxidoreductase, luciferase family (includes alkanesulfonate monooxygenase SsuD and methylene tetrahydromethanopterin reductase) [Agreia sp. VKM Ac-1783]
MSRTPFHLGIALDGAGWHPAAWRLDAARPAALFDADYWVSLVVEAQSAGIDLVTIEDSLGLQTSGFGAVELRRDEVRGRLDALLLANTIAAQVPGIGIVPTVTTTHTEPFHTATGIQTLDHVSEGWAGWRVQVSARSHEAAHVGRRAIPALDPVAAAVGTDEEQSALIRQLFGEAADAIEVAHRLWDSWEDDAVIRDVATGRFIDRERLHYVDFEGESFSVKGPSIVPRSPQGQPVVYVLAHQQVPYELAVAQADIVGITPHSDEHLERILGELGDTELRVERRVNDPLRIWTEAVVLIEDTREKAAEALAALDELHRGTYASDAVILADTAENVAAQLLRWQQAGVTGVRLRPARLPLDLERITRGVVPVLDETGVLERPRDASTLRQRLGFAPATNRYATARPETAELIESANR